MSVLKNVLRNAATGASGKPRVSFENYEDGISADDMAVAQQLELDQNAAMEELNELGHEIEMEGQEGEILAEAVETYPRVVEMIEEDIESNGGVSTESAKYLNFILDRAGLNGLVNVSVENFGDNTRRLGETRVSLEGIKETLRNWWENLLAWFKKMREKMKKWWVKNFSAAAAIKSRAANLADRAKKITSSNAKEKKLSFPRLQSTLMTNGKLDGNTLAAGLKVATDLGNGIFGEWQEKSIAAAEDLLNVIDSANVDKAGLDALGSNIVSSLQKAGAVNPTGMSTVVGDVPDAYGKNNSADYDVKMSAVLPGQKALFLRQRKNSPAGTGIGGLQNAVDWLSTRAFKMDDAVKKVVEDRDTSIDTLTTQQVEAIAGQIEDFAAVIENYQRNFKKQEDANQNIDKFKKIADQATDENDSDVVKAQNLLKKMPNALKDMINEPATGFAAYFMRTANAALAVCEKSLAQY
ncbi:hypothetical protein DQR70_05635 [Salmonella enterica subsp. enterica serovar Oslo]|nr:hypothetical protein [Salmonella enterica subsp. enterica serovar Oslo]EEX4841237.1 hypothetical protein [Escherichia coli]ELF5187198.1 hypothetical protein [Salmonella enterica]